MSIQDKSHFTYLCISIGLTGVRMCDKLAISNYSVSSAFREQKYL